jgi:hypothetical protein
LKIYLLYDYYIYINTKMGIGDWGLGIGDWGLGPIPKTPKTQNPKPQTPNQKKKNKKKI